MSLKGILVKTEGKRCLSHGLMCLMRINRSPVECVVALVMLVATVSGCGVTGAYIEVLSKTSVELEIVTDELVVHSPVTIVRGMCHSNATVTLYDANGTVVGQDDVGAGSFEVKGTAVAAHYDVDGDVVLSGMYVCESMVNGTAMNTDSVAIDNACVVAYFYDTVGEFL